MPTSSFRVFEDGRVRFDYPEGYSIDTSSEHGQFYYSFTQSKRRVPAAVLQILTREHQAEPYRRMHRNYRPLSGPVVRQIVHRHGTIQTEHFKGLEWRISDIRDEDGTSLGENWSVFFDFGDVWAYFDTRWSRKSLDEAVWSRVVYSVRARA